MKLGQQLKIKQNQSLIMTPQLQQAIKLLQLTNIELSDFIDKAKLENPFLKDRKNIQKLKTKRGFDISLLKTPVHVSDSNFQDKTAPELGEDTDDVLKEVGFTGEQISTFKNKGII